MTASNIARFVIARFATTAIKLSLMVMVVGSCFPVLTVDEVLLRPGTFSSLGSGTIQATVGEVVQSPARVRVLDTDGEPMAGQSVSFTASGGVVSPSSTTTNSSGEAVLDSWATPTNAGPATITAALPGSGLPSITFSATVNPGPPVNITSSQSATTAEVNSDVNASVTVQDQYGNGVPQLSVSWVVGDAGSGATTTGGNTTNASGVASTAWRLDTKVRVNTLTASVGGTGLTATFSATGTAGAPSKIDNVSDATMQGSPGTVAPEDPEVKVTDQYDNAIEGVGVTWSVQAGTGTVSVSDPACNDEATCESFTNDNGRTKVSNWQLGPEFGTQELRASLSSNSSVQQTFTVTTGDDPCNTSIAIDPDDSKSGTLTSTDCNSDSRYVDLYDMTVSGTSHVATTLSATGFVPQLRGYIYREVGEDAYWYNEGASPIAMYWVLGPGTHIFAVTSQATPDGGDYTLSTVLNPPMPTNCGFFGATLNINVVHELNSAHCTATHQAAPSTTVASRTYLYFLPPGASASVRMWSGAGIDSYLEAFDVTGTAIGSGSFITADDQGCFDCPAANGARLNLSNSGSSGRFIEIRASHWHGQFPSLPAAYNLQIDP